MKCIVMFMGRPERSEVKNPEQAPRHLGGPDYFVVRVAEGDRKRFSALPKKSIACCALRASGQQVARTTQDKQVEASFRGIQPKEIKIQPSLQGFKALGVDPSPS